MALTAAQKKAAADAKVKAQADAKAADEAILTSLKINHPQWAQWIISNPELKATVLKWAKLPGGPTQEMIDAATYPTKLVQEYNNFQQRLDKLQALAPGQYKYEVGKANEWADAEIARQGFQVSSENHQKIVDAILTNGWGQGNQNIATTVASYFDIGTRRLGTELAPNEVSAKTSGTVSAALADFSKIASDYAIPVPTDPNQLNDFVKQAIGPNGSEQAFTDYAKTQAIQLYPWMKGSIEAGGTVKGYFAPVGTQIANTLGINPADINWQDPKWSGLVTSYDPVSKITAPRNINDILATVKTDPKYGYDTSLPAINNAYDLAASIKGIFGQGSGKM
jgi:hypothetical protein